MKIVATLALLVSSIVVFQASAFARGAKADRSGQASSLIRVFVETGPGDGQDYVQRQQSVKDLVNALASKKKTIVLVDDDLKADVVIDVRDRAIEVPKVVLGVDVRPGRSIGAGSPVTRAILKVNLTSGPEDLNLKNKNTANDNPGGWKSAAEDLADQIEKWINSHKTEILDRRGGLAL